jgi:hypothetical protein
MPSGFEAPDRRGTRNPCGSRRRREQQTRRHAAYQIAADINANREELSRLRAELSAVLADAAMESDKQRKS